MKTVVEMAKECGVHEYGPLTRNWSFELSQLERFFNLAFAAGAAHERDKLEVQFNKMQALHEIREGQPNKPCCLAEREACA